MSSTYVEKIKGLPQVARRLLGISSENSKLSRENSQTADTFHRPGSQHLTSLNDPVSSGYNLLYDKVVVESKFLLLKKKIFAKLNEDRLGFLLNNDRETANYSSSARFWKESGAMENKYLYFYIKPMGEEGWLFEMNESGWTVCRAEKIVKTNTFLRTTNLWDRVQIHCGVEDQSQLRVNSHAFNCELTSFSYYQTLMEEFVSKALPPKREEKA